MWQDLLQPLLNGDRKTLARTISLVENAVPGYEQFLQALPEGNAGITGVTGPPGAGKSTLTDALIGEMVKAGKQVAVLCVDPSSPFHLGALLGDRIRMSEWYNHPAVFIRSLATRGSLGGLHPYILEITELMKAAGFDHILIETVGVGQSEIEIAGLADTTVVVLVPESGDEVQTMKAGLMEIADIFVVNKADRPEADAFVQNLRQMLAPAFQHTQTEIPILKTAASQKQGIHELFLAIDQHQSGLKNSDRKFALLAERAYQLIQRQRMQDISKQELKEKLQVSQEKNLYKFINRFF
jgi:LAO/AO transport system kinase